jgi:hypothetical protein
MNNPWSEDAAINTFVPSLEADSGNSTPITTSPGDPWLSPTEKIENIKAAEAKATLNQEFLTKNLITSAAPPKEYQNHVPNINIGNNVITVNAFNIASNSRYERII